MRIFLQIIVISALAVSMFNLTTGCSSGDRELDGYLERAEELMEPSPDSAYSILTDSITSAMLSGASERQSALYALLLTQSRFKTYVPVDNDSLITSAVKYFEKKDDRPRLMKSLYYQARILRDNGEYSDAMSAAMHAHAIAQLIKDDFWQARCADIIAQMFGTYYHYDEGVKYGDEAINLYSRTGADAFYIYALTDQALRYNNLGRFNECGSLLDTIKERIQIPDVMDEELKKIVIVDVARTAQLMYSALGNYEKAEDMGDTILKYEDYLTNSATACALMAKIKIKLGKTDDAQKLLEHTLPKLGGMRDSLFYYDALKEYYSYINNPTQLLETTQKLLQLYDQAFTMVTNQNVMYAQRDYYSEEVERIETIAERNRQLLFICIVLGITLIIIGILIYQNRINRKDADISKKMTEIMLLSRTLQQTHSEKDILHKELAKHDADIEELSSILSKQNSEIEELSADLLVNQGRNAKLNSMVRSLLQGRFVQLNSIITEYANQEENEANYIAFYKNIKHEIEKFKQPKNLHEIERMVDESLDGVITKIREQIPSMREKDITFIALMLAGLNARAIGLFLGMHPNSTYKRKRQLLRIIAESTAVDKDWILALILND